MAADMVQASQLFEELKNESWVLKAIEKHFAARDLKCDPRVQILILYFSEVVGVAVGVIQTCKEWAVLENKTEISMDDFCKFICPRIGFKI